MADYRNDYEFVIKNTKRLECLLEERFGAQGRGLHTKITSVEDHLPERLVKRLRFIASIRNRLVHDDSLAGLDDPNAFREACASAEHELNLLTPSPDKIQAVIKNLLKRDGMPGTTEALRSTINSLFGKDHGSDDTENLIQQLVEHGDIELVNGKVSYKGRLAKKKQPAAKKKMQPDKKKPIRERTVDEVIDDLRRLRDYESSITHGQSVDIFLKDKWFWNSDAMTDEHGLLHIYKVENGFKYSVTMHSRSGASCGTVFPTVAEAKADMHRFFTDLKDEWEFGYVDVPYSCED